MCCSCTIMDRGSSGRDRQNLLLYAQKLFNISIMTPAAIAERTVEGNDAEIQLLQQLLEARYEIEEISDKEWEITVTFGKSEFHTHVTFIGKNENDKCIFYVTTEGADRARLESYGNINDINATFEFLQGHITLVHPRHPLALDSLRDYWERVYGEGMVNLTVRRNGTETDRVEIGLSEAGADITCNLGY